MASSYYGVIFLNNFIYTDSNVVSCQNKYSVHVGYTAIVVNGLKERENPHALDARKWWGTRSGVTVKHTVVSRAIR
jgi:hypothetical protein